VGPNESSIAFYNLIHVVACQVDEQRNGSWVKLFFWGGVGLFGWVIASSLRNSQLREEDFYTRSVYQGTKIEKVREDFTTRVHSKAKER